MWHMQTDWLAAHAFIAKSAKGSRFAQILLRCDLLNLSLKCTQEKLKIVCTVSKAGRGRKQVPLLILRLQALIFF